MGGFAVKRPAAACLAAALSIGAAAARVDTQAGRPQFSTYFTRDEFAGRRARIA
jgi:hypothetical protein